MITRWNIKTPREEAVKELSQKGGLTVPAAMALACGGMDTIEKAAEFFGQADDTDEQEDYSDPMLIRDMDKACGLIGEAVESGELICIYGDYDCDGVTAAAVLYTYLRDIGGNVMTFINERCDGYGMNCEAVRELSRRGVRMIVTVDNGISAVAEAELCAELGITLVITDHHQAGETLPMADAVVDPHRSDCPSTYKDFCGCGLVLKLIAAMENGDMDFAVEQYSDLAAIATVADVVPLTGENRMIVRHGLHYLENTENQGLQALIAKSGIKPPYTSGSVAFSLAPRINAAGRIGSPMDAFALLTEEDPDEAERIADNICSLNTKRRDFEKVIMDDIERQTAADPAFHDKAVLVFYGEGWHHGVIGIVAARCTEKYGKPVFLLSWGEGETEARGSARSVDGFNIFKALSYCSDTLSKYGGHGGAGGFSAERDRIAGFDKKLQEYAKISAKENGVPRRNINVCGMLSPQLLTVEQIEGLDVLEPFGEGNPRPVFLLPDCVISDVIPISEGAHTKLMVRCGGALVTGLMFGTRTDSFAYRKGDEVNLLISPEINSYNGRKSVALKITDIRRKGLNQQKMIAAEEVYCSLRRGEKPDSRLIPKLIPSREELAAVYRAMGMERIYAEVLYGRLVSDDMNYCKFLICLDIFSESGLVEYDRCSGYVSIIRGAPKADTQLAPTMIKLKAML
ncbi:MAG: single-stranded-DNA-specific exonuclease RecJ [Huintestinicola sp.]